jgi:6-phosphogluconolactonase (cycloisomerase 2 family)
MVPVNDAPLDPNDANTVTEDTTLTVAANAGLLVGASDPEGDALTITAYTIAGINGPQTVGAPVMIPNVGTLTINSDGSYSFTPVANYTGVIPVATYTISDGHGGSDTSTLTLTMVPVNDLPLDGNEAHAVSKDTTLTVAASSVDGLLHNASDVDGNTLTIANYTIAGINGTQTVGVPVTIPNVGTLTINADGSYSFTPLANYTGPIPVATYTVTDGSATDISTLTLTMSGIVDGNETNTVTEDTLLTVSASAGLLLNATDIDGYAMTVTGYSIAGISGTQSVGSPVSIPNVGTLTINANGSYSFMPVSNYTGTIPVATYTISNGRGATDTSTLTLTMVPVNDAPLDPNDTNTVTEDTTLTVAANAGLLVGASDPEGDTLTITAYTIAGINGPQTVGAPVTIPNVGTLTINSDGSYSFTPVANYTGAIPVATYTISDGHGGTDTSTLTLTMVAVDDVFTDNNEVTSTPEDTPKTGNVIDSGLTSNDGAITVTSFTIAGVTGTFNAGNTAATIPNVGSITIGTNGAYTFTPLPNWNGVVPTITYSLSDGFGALETSDLVITVTPVNDVPVAVDDRYRITEEGETIVLNPLSADRDPDGDTLTIISINGTTLTPGTAQTIQVPDGIVEVSTSGVISFTPDIGFNGTVSFPYEISDGHGCTATANEIITTLPLISNASPPLNEQQRQTDSRRVVANQPYERRFEEKPIELGKYEFHTVVLNFNGPYGGINQFSLPTVESTSARGALEHSNHTPYERFDRIADQVQVERHRDAMTRLFETNDDFGLRNALKLPELEANSNGDLVYQLPDNTFIGGKGDVALVAVLADGKPLPKWMKFNPVTGQLEANVPKELSAPIDVRIIATDANGDQAKASVRIKLTVKKAAFVGKSSLASQIKSAMMLNQ